MNIPIVITGNRASGKTVELIKLASETQFPILTAHPGNARYFESVCDLLKIQRVTTYVIRDINTFKAFLNLKKPYYIDDFEHFIATVFHCESTLLQAITTNMKNYHCNEDINRFVFIG